MGKSTERINVFLSKENKELIQYATTISGHKSVSSFIKHCIEKESKSLIIEHNKVIKSIDDAKVFIELINGNNEPNDKLIQANKNYKNSITNS